MRKIFRGDHSDIPSEGSFLVEFPDGHLEYIVDGKLHREDGPAMIYYSKYGTTYLWFYKGEKHRIGGPAVICANGDEEWRQNGILHRNPSDGPARLCAGGNKPEWYYRGNRLSTAQRLNMGPTMRMLGENNG